jgi:hypothetical protein
LPPARELCHITKHIFFPKVTIVLHILLCQWSHDLVHFVSVYAFDPSKAFLARLGIPSILLTEPRARRGRRDGLKVGANGERLFGESTRGRRPTRLLEREEPEREDEEDMRLCRCAWRGSTPGNLRARANRARTRQGDSLAELKLMNEALTVYYGHHAAEVALQDGCA